MIHYAYGNGKGKTTAALGQAIRAAGSGMRVLVVQFFKNRETGELASLAKLGIPVLRGCAGDGISLDEAILAQCRVIHNANLKAAMESPAELIVLDEVADALRLGALDEALLRQALQQDREWMLTGHKKIEWLAETADYVSHVEKEKHPFDRGQEARRGIEY